MALIKCPECNGQVSDKAEVCIHCGYPINKVISNSTKNQVSSEQFNSNIKNINGKKYDLTEVINHMQNGKRMEALNTFINITGCHDVNEAINEIKKLEKTNEKVNIVSQVKCPKCGSTQIQMVPRKWSFMTGFLTNKVDRVCMNCKHKF